MSIGLAGGPDNSTVNDSNNWIPVTGLATVTLAGPYILTYSVEAVASVAGDGIDCAIAVNGTVSNQVIEASHSFADSSDWATIGGVGALTFAAGDTVEVVCSGLNLTVNASFAMFAVDDLTQAPPLAPV